MQRLLKQFSYAVLFLVLIVGVPAGIYYGLLKPAPTCSDGVRNGTELGVDCGGNCPRACVPSTLKSLEAASGVKIIPVDQGHVSFLVEVVNANLGFAARSFDYEIALEEGSSTQRFEGKSYVYAGEVRTFVFPNLSVDSAAIGNATIAFKNMEWVPKDSWKRPQLQVQSASARRENGKLVVEGVLRNDDLIAFPTVEIAAMFRGKHGELLGVSRTEIENMVPAQARSFELFHPDIPNAEVNSTGVFSNAARP